MGPFFIKDFLLFWRDRKEMLVSLITPIVLIIVLGFMMPSWVENPVESLEMTVALVNEDDEADGIRQFLESGSAEGDEAFFRGMAEQASVIGMLNQLFGDEQVTEWLTLVELDADNALKQLEEEEVIAIITIPEGFTLAALNKMLLGEGSGAALKLVAENSSFEVDVLNDMLDGFIGTVNFQTVLHQVLGEEVQPPVEGNLGGIEKVPGVEMLTSFQYFTMAMGVIFPFFYCTDDGDKGDY